MPHNSHASVQQSLTAIYDNFRAKTMIPEALAVRLSSPLLLSITDAWLSSNYRILIVGQEVLGWAFEPGQYYDWPHEPIRNFNDFKEHPNAVAELIEGHRAFDFAKHQPENYRGCFMRAYRKFRAELEADVDGSVLFTNLFRMSVDGGSVLRNSTPEQLTLLREKQLGLLRAEITCLKPQVVIFFTGPTCDETLSQEFADIKFESMGLRPIRAFARLSHPNLPPCSLRTFHPTYLQRKGLSAILGEITRSVRDTVAGRPNKAAVPI
jgi:hypothetical protein